MVTVLKKEKREITVMFTDLKDSTVYFEKKGDIKGRLLIEKHNRLLFPIIEQYNGVLIKTIGDAIMARFDIPLHGVAAAVEMQQVLKNYNTSAKDPLKVRIGLHTGIAIVENSDVFGDTVNLAARIESGTDPEKITISEDTFKAIRKFPFIKTEPLGSIKYKGKAQEVKTHQVKWFDTHINSNTLPTNLKAKKGKTITLNENRNSGKKRIIIILIALATLGLGGFVAYPYLLGDSPSRDSEKKETKRAKIVQYAKGFLNQKIPKSKHWKQHSSGFVKMVFINSKIPIGRPLQEKNKRGKWLSVTGLIHQYIQENGKLYSDQLPQSGDLVFFNNTFDRNHNKRPDDLLTSVGLVIDVDPDETIHFLYYTKKKVQIFQLNLKTPKIGVVKNKNVEKQINTKIMWRNKKQKRRGFPEYAGALFNGYGSIF